jgi:hypothetical protein
MDVTPSNVKEMLKISYEKPVILLIASSSCNSCKNRSLTWANLSDRFESDRGILVAYCDCEQEATPCWSFTSTGYPSYARVENGEHTAFKVEDNLDALTKVAEEAKTHWRDEDCRELSFTKQYPSFVHSDSPENGHGCAAVKKLNAKYGKRIVFVNRTNPSSTFAVFFHRHKFFQIEGNVTATQMESLIDEYQSPPFTPLKPKFIKKSPRSVFVIFINDLDDLRPYRRFAADYSEHFIFMTLPFEEHRKLIPRMTTSESDARLVMVGDATKTQFSAFWDYSDTDALFTTTLRILNRKLKYNHTGDFLRVFDSRISVPTEAKSNRLFYACAILVAAVIASALLFFLKFRTVHKIE